MSNAHAAETSKPIVISAQIVCECFAEKLRKPLFPSSKSLEFKERSSDKKFAAKSAKLLEDTLLTKIDFRDFYYISFSLGDSSPDSWVSIYAFAMKDSKKADDFISSVSHKHVGIQGLLITEAPQRYEVMAVDNILCAIVVERAPRDTLVNALLDVFHDLKKLDAREK